LVNRYKNGEPPSSVYRCYPSRRKDVASRFRVQNHAARSLSAFHVGPLDEEHIAGGAIRRKKGDQAVGGPRLTIFTEHEIRGLLSEPGILVDDALSGSRVDLNPEIPLPIIQGYPGVRVRAAQEDVISRVQLTRTEVPSEAN